MTYFTLRCQEPDDTQKAQTDKQLKPTQTPFFMRKKSNAEVGIHHIVHYTSITLQTADTHINTYMTF